MAVFEGCEGNSKTWDLEERKCPKCGEGELIRRKATKGKMKGRFFYGCERYPDCD